MSVTLLEVLQNARFNLLEGRLAMQKELGREQLLNAIVLFEKGYSPNNDFDEVMGDNGSVNDVPDKK